MNANEFSDLMKDITKRFESEFSFESQQNRQEQYDPKMVLKTALSFVDGNTEELLIDILEIITLFLLRGPKISKINDNIKESGKKRINVLKQKYKLKDFASTEEVAKGKALSLKKLIPAFPYQLLIVMKNEKYDRPLNRDVLKVAEADSFPDFLKTTTFLSVIPFPGESNNTNIWPPDGDAADGTRHFLTVIQAVIAYEFLESFVLHKWGNKSVPLTPAKALWNVISVAQNILNSNFINQKMREDNFGSFFKNDILSNFTSIQNLIDHTETKYPGFKETLNEHFDYNLRSMKFQCKAKVFCRHLER